MKLAYCVFLAITTSVTFSSASEDVVNADAVYKELLPVKEKWKVIGTVLHKEPDDLIEQLKKVSRNSFGLEDQLVISDTLKKKRDNWLELKMRWLASISEDDSVRLKEMLKDWILNNRNPTWSDVIKALRHVSVNEATLADVLEVKYGVTGYCQAEDCGLNDKNVENSKSASPNENEPLDFSKAGVEKYDPLEGLAKMMLSSLNTLFLEVFKAFEITCSDYSECPQEHLTQTLKRLRTTVDSMELQLSRMNIRKDDFDKIIDSTDQFIRVAKSAFSPKDNRNVQRHMHCLEQYFQWQQWTYPIEDIEQLLEAAEDISDWKVLCQLPGILEGTRKYIENEVLELREKKEECLTAYFNSAEEVYWEEFIGFIMEPPLNNIELANEIAESYLSSNHTG